MKLPIYFDHHATTPVDSRVLETMLPYFSEKFGNAASRSHSFGWEALEAVDTARKQIANLIHARPREIIFTSGATESDNLALKGVAQAHREKGNHIVTLATEHKAVLDTCHRLETEGSRVTILPVNADGRINLNRLEDALTPGAVLVSIMAAHNETGVIQPVAEIGRLCRDRGIPYHSDAVQAVGKIPIDVEAMNIDLMSLTAHKMYGPKGVGALYVREQKPGLSIAPLIDGGGHERGFRSGTLNVPGIVGLGAACALCQREMPGESARLSVLRDQLLGGIFSRLDDVHINGSMEHRLPHNLNLSFGQVQADTLMMSLADIAISTGSACTSARPEPSFVLKAMGVPDHLAYASLRFGLGRFTTGEEVDYVIARIAEAVTSLRGLAVTSGM
ncbi:MAG: IscS subfamily cysteine desulfurase [Terriglobia bacterium]